MLGYRYREVRAVPNPGNIDEGLSAIISGVVTLAAVVLAVTILPGLTIIGLLTTNLQVTLLLVGTFMFLAYFTEQTGQLSFPFVLSMIAILLLINHFILPPSISGIFAWEQWLGIELGTYNAADFAVLSTIVILLYWVVTIRLSGRAKKAETIADRVGKKSVKLVETYVTLGRIAAVTVVGFAYVVLAQSGDLFAQFGDIIGQAPFVFSNIVAGIAGFDALGGDVPIIGDIPILSNLSPTAWAFFIIILLVFAASAKYESSGPLSRVFN